MSNSNPLLPRLWAIVLVACLVWPTSSIGDAAQWPTDGVVFSANVSSGGSSGGTSVLVSKDTIGAGKVYVVQTWCVGGNAGGHHLYVGGGSGEARWDVYSANSCSGGICCYSYNPGLVVPSGVDLMTSSTSNSYYSNVTGVITDDPAIPAATPTPTPQPPTSTPEPTYTPCVGIDCGIFGV